MSEDQTRSKNADYLGDGVYADVDRNMVRLWTEREEGTHEIFLEPEVYSAVERYVLRMIEQGQLQWRKR